MNGTEWKTTHSMIWRGATLELLDQRRLPREVSYLSLMSAADAAEAIRSMAVRGAPAIGIVAAYGLVLEAGRAYTDTEEVVRCRVEEAANLLIGARPTAVNLRWAVERMLEVLRASVGSGAETLVSRLELEARAIHAEDVAVNRAIGSHGAPLLAECSGVLTHCNTGALATGGYGTALGMIRRARADGAQFRVYACETRPFFQGSRLTAWELDNEGIPVTVLVDGAAGALMAAGTVQAVVVGADRVAADGAVANKIGTYALAVLAATHGIPFYVAAPTSTLDPDTPDGDAIPIESRPADEVRYVGEILVGAPAVAVHNPAFDVTPPRFVTAIVTEVGVIRPPFEGAVTGAVEQGRQWSARHRPVSLEGETGPE